jgi:hypothetical protein
LVVADELYQMPDATLRQLARMAIPNAMKESTMVHCGRLKSQNDRAHQIMIEKEARDRSGNKTVMKISGHEANLQTEIFCDEKTR